MSDPERVAIVLRGVIIVVVGTLLLYAVDVIVNKYRSRYPALRIFDWALTAASGAATLAVVAYVMTVVPFPTKAWLPLISVITLEILPRSFREGFWNDLSARAIAIAACLFTISEVRFAWWR